MSLLRALDARPGGQATQRDVAVALALSKVAARRRVRAAAEEGLIAERVDDSPAAPRRRLFSLTPGKGRAELERLGRGGL